MPRDIERAMDEMKTGPPVAPDALGDAESEPDVADRPSTPARSTILAMPADLELLRFRQRLDQQLAARREAKSGASLATIATAPAPGVSWHALLIWIVPIAACVFAAAAGWWLASAPTARAGIELAQARQALQQEQDKAEKLGAALAAADKAAYDQERDTQQQALQQAESAAAAFAQSLVQQRDRSHQLEQRLAAHREAAPAPAPAPAADATSDKTIAETADLELLRLMSRANLLLTQGEIGAARIVLERAADTAMRRRCSR